VLEREILVLELVPVDRFTPGAVLVGKVAALAHEPGNHPVKRRLLEPKPGLSRAQLTEVFRGFRAHVLSELLLYVCVLLLLLLLLLLFMKEEEDHQRSSAPAKMNGTKNESSLLPPVDDDWKKVIENFHRHRREKTTNINAFARRRRKHFA
tara:strand:+ start:2694 stop:3146 length:453 start_codon:yes stop_codon:yes gene_type:complete